MKKRITLLASHMAVILLSYTAAATSTPDNNEASHKRDLWQKKKNKRGKKKRREFRNKQKDTWNRKKPNAWKGQNNSGEDDVTELIFIEGDCSYRYESVIPDDILDAALDDGVDLIPIDDEGVPNPDGIFLDGDHFFKSCDIFHKGLSNRLPTKAGTTKYVCLVIKTTQFSTQGNDAFFDCSILDELTFGEYENYGIYGYNQGMDGGYLHYSDKYYNSTLESKGAMKGYGTNFDLATVGGTGGGIQASGQLSIIESGYEMKYVHIYYIHAPNLRKGFPW